MKSRPKKKVEVLLSGQAPPIRPPERVKTPTHEPDVKRTIRKGGSGSSLNQKKNKISRCGALDFEMTQRIVRFDPK